MISIILTSQKYILVPSAIRSNLTMLFTFQLNNLDIDQLKKELIRCDTSIYNFLIKIILMMYQHIYLKMFQHL